MVDKIALLSGRMAEIAITTIVRVSTDTLMSVIGRRLIMFVTCQAGEIFPVTQILVTLGAIIPSINMLARVYWK